MPGASQLIAGAPTASALLARKGKMFISHGSALDRASSDSRSGRWLAKGQRRSSTSEFFENGSSRGKHPGGD